MPGKNIVLSLFVLVAVTLACSLPNVSTTPQAEEPPTVVQQQVDATKIALEIQSTLMAEQLTQNAEQPTAEPPAIPTQEPTQEPTQSQPDTPVPSTQPVPTPEADIEERMKTAKILVYEDTQDIGLWIRDALDGMGLTYTHIGDRSGDFMSQLNSSTQWDLIIVGAEAKTKVQGEFWDVIVERVSQKDTALIAEVWYLDRLGEGRIKSLLTGCGVRFQRDWDLAESIYWLQSDHPVFSEPNGTVALIHYNQYWWTQAGDLIKLSPGSNATLLAGTFQKQKSDYGVLATCYDGRVILQTFSNHDYRYNEIIPLWQNYVYHTLKNHFLAVP
jgi:hypothetical protein